MQTIKFAMLDGKQRKRTKAITALVTVVSVNKEEVYSGKDYEVIWKPFFWKEEKNHEI